MLLRRKDVLHHQLEPVLALQADERVALPSARADQPAVRRMEVRGGRVLDRPPAIHAEAFPSVKDQAPRRSRVERLAGGAPL